MRQERRPRPAGRQAPTYPEHGVVHVVQHGVLLLEGVLLAERHIRVNARDAGARQRPVLSLGCRRAGFGPGLRCPRARTAHLLRLQPAAHMLPHFVLCRIAPLPRAK